MERAALRVMVLDDDQLQIDFVSALLHSMGIFDILSAVDASSEAEFESVRDFVSSSTLVVLTDLPFCLLFFGVIAWMGGSLVWVPLAVGGLILVCGALTQWPVRRSVERYQYESTQKHAMLIESMERLERWRIELARLITSRDLA